LTRKSLKRNNGKIDNSEGQIFSFSKPNLITNGTFDIINGNLRLISYPNSNKEDDNCSYVFSENNTTLTIDGIPYTKQ